MRQQAGPNSGRVFASEERFTIIIQHGMLRTVEDVAKDVRNQSTGDPLDTPAMLKRLLGSTGGAGDDDDLIMSDDMEVSLRCPLRCVRVEMPSPRPFRHCGFHLCSLSPHRDSCFTQSCSPSLHPFLLLSHACPHHRYYFSLFHLRTSDCCASWVMFALDEWLC
jgi:hypothetical protein